MNKFLISALALGTVLTAAPAMAQSDGRPYPGYAQPRYDDNQGYGRNGVVSPWQVRQMVERSIQRGEVSRGEARELRADVEDLMRLDRRLRSGGDYGRQRAVERKTQDVLRDLSEARRDGRDGRDGDGRRDWYRDRNGY